ncbi:MAG TPA: hypothetical protein HA326_03410 [Thermoplasmata archaeon]|nr:hypothetical protein [Thermoplasmata archaeon]
MALEAKVGILRDRLVVEGEEYPLRREGRGWVSVPAIGGRPGGRVRYDALHDRVRIEGPGGSAQIPFRWKRTVFTFGGKEYRVGPMAWGHVMVSRADRPVMTGRLTMHGVRLGYVAPELQPISHELAVGLAYRATALWLAASAGRASH